MDNKAIHNNKSFPNDPRCVGSVCILGCGITGSAVEEYFLSLPTPPKIDFYKDESEVSEHYDLGIVSPGIPPFSKVVKSALANCTELISEPELAFRLSPHRWIVVTGTNGKTTTTALTTHLLNSCGFTACYAGNIGVTCIEAVRRRKKDEYIVAELSSYQLAYSKSIVPDGAILLNITPDHIDWHGSYIVYRDAKLSIFERMCEGQPVAIDATLEATHSIVKQRIKDNRRVIALGGLSGLREDMTLDSTECEKIHESAFVDSKNNMLTCVIDGVKHSILPASELIIKGEHNQENALAAAAIVLALGAPANKVAKGLKSFEALEHRIEYVAELNGVMFYNDSKATNPEATCKALGSFGEQDLIVLLGGKDKGTPLQDLVTLAQNNCKAVVCYGESGSRFYQAFMKSKTTSKELKVALVADLCAAFELACCWARPGYVVLLSPASASFDEFSSYEKRGERFKQLVCALSDCKDKV